MKRIIWIQCVVEVLVQASLLTDILSKEIKYPNHNRSKVTQCPQNIKHFTILKFLLQSPLLDALCDCLFYTEAYANSITLGECFVFNIKSFMLRYCNPSQLGTSSCALCTSDKAILLQSPKGAVICLNEPNSITVYTAFLVKAFLHLLCVWCDIICFSCG